MSEIARYTFDFSQRLQKNEVITAVWFYTESPITAVSHDETTATLYAMPFDSRIQCDVWTNQTGPSYYSASAGTGEFR